MFDFYMPLFDDLCGRSRAFSGPARAPTLVSLVRQAGLMATRAGPGKFLFPLKVRLLFVFKTVLSSWYNYYINASLYWIYISKSYNIYIIYIGYIGVIGQFIKAYLNAVLFWTGINILKYVLNIQKAISNFSDSLYKSLSKI